jgi:hypothetical protein
MLCDSSARRCNIFAASDIGSFGFRFPQCVCWLAQGPACRAAPDGDPNNEKGSVNQQLALAHPAKKHDWNKNASNASGSPELGASIEPVVIIFFEHIVDVVLPSARPVSNCPSDCAAIFIAFLLGRS